MSKKTNKMSRRAILAIFITAIVLIIKTNFWHTDNEIQIDLSRKSSKITYTKPRILRKFPHDTLAYTQGLLFHRGLLYESTGKYGQSSLRCLDPYQNGKILNKIKLNKIYFGEGLVLKDRHLVQITWKKGKAFVYTLPDFSVVDTFSYHGQGWGITSDNNYYLMTNGSDTLYYRDSLFRIIKKVRVKMDNGESVKFLNEIEYVSDKLYANIYPYNYILEINPKTGKVLKGIDCTQLVKAASPIKNDEVLNGIAYKGNGIFYLTGKNWRYIFEVRIF